MILLRTAQDWRLIALALALLFLLACGSDIEGTNTSAGGATPDSSIGGDALDQNVESASVIRDDIDGDGIPNDKDEDADGDGILNADEGEPDADQDQDGVPNHLDTDSDGDGIADALEGSLDTDGDGLIDSLDTDSDNDGVDDSVEGGQDTDGDGAADNVDTDADGDGITDDADPDANGNGVDDENETNGDDNGDAADSGGEDPRDDTAGNSTADEVEGGDDTDGNGTADEVEGDDDTDGDEIPDEVEGDVDTDGDGKPNYLDTDSDDDGIGDAVEGDVDTDGDGKPNYLDTDSDGDEINDRVEGLVDTDGDGVPNFLDLDSDGDACADADEAAQTADEKMPARLDPNRVCVGGDGTPDDEDNCDQDEDEDQSAKDEDQDEDGASDDCEEDDESVVPGPDGIRCVAPQGGGIEPDNHGELNLRGGSISSFDFVGGILDFACTFGSGDPSGTCPGDFMRGIGGTATQSVLGKSGSQTTFVAPTSAGAFEWSVPLPSSCERNSIAVHPLRSSNPIEDVIISAAGIDPGAIIPHLGEDFIAQFQDELLERTDPSELWRLTDDAASALTDKNRETAGLGILRGTGGNELSRASGLLTGAIPELNWSEASSTQVATVDLAILGNVGLDVWASADASTIQALPVGVLDAYTPTEWQAAGDELADLLTTSQVDFVTTNIDPNVFNEFDLNPRRPGVFP